MYNIIMMMVINEDVILLKYNCDINIGILIHCFIRYFEIKLIMMLEIEIN